MKHAVFANRAERVSEWTNWDKAQDAWTKLDDERRAADQVHDVFYEVRSSDDPHYRDLPRKVEQLPYVKLSRLERERLLKIGRTAGGCDDAADAMLTELLADPRFEDLSAAEISDYTWSAARFCFPHEAKYL